VLSLQTVLTCDKWNLANEISEHFYSSAKFPESGNINFAFLEDFVKFECLLVITPTREKKLMQQNHENFFTFI